MGPEGRWDTSVKARALGQGTQAGPSGPAEVFPGVLPVSEPRFQPSLAQLSPPAPSLGCCSLARSAQLTLAAPLAPF